MDREVTHAGKLDGVVTEIGGTWGIRSKAAATVDIQNRAHTYHLLVDGRRLPVLVVVSPNGRYLRTVQDLSAPDPLLRLPTLGMTS